MSKVDTMQGDCLERMKGMLDKSVNTCVTSPPYFGLRDYGQEGQLGLEASPDDFVESLVRVFREVRRVLRDDGTIWLNLGDSYARQGGRVSHQPRHWDGRKKTAGSMHQTRIASDIGMKEKDLIGIPWRTALALQADGWYLRQDIIWHKPNPMPEKVRDRCTKSHEYIFLLSKSPKYYYDYEKIKEPQSDNKGFRNLRSVWTITSKPYKDAHFATFPPDLIEPCILAGCPKGGTVLDPFGGSGTTAGVAVANDRNAIICELNPEYCELIPDRVASIVAKKSQIDLFSTNKRGKDE